MVAKRDASKVAKQLWTFPTPKGPQGRHISGRYRYWGIWTFSPNKPAAKSLLLYLSSRDAIGKLMEAGQGFDVPRFEKLNDFGIWAAAEPPKGFLYNFPRRRGSAGRCDSQGIRCKMIANLRSYALTINQGDPTPMGDGGRRF